MADATPDHPLDRFVTWIDRAPLQMRSSVSLTFSVVLVVVSVLRRVGGDFGDARQVLTHQILGLAILLGLTIATRAVGVRRVLSFWLFGFFLVGPFVDLTGSWLAERMTGNGMQAGVVPVLEEVAKLVPVLLFAAGKLRRGRTPAASDLLVLGAAVGGGFAFHEDLLWERAATSGLAGPGVLLPTMLQDPMFAAGHVVWTACAALGVGLMCLHRHRRWAFVLGPVLLAAPLLDHMVVNVSGPKRADLRSAMLDGRLLVWLFVACVAGAVLVEHRLRAAASSTDDRLPPVPGFVDIVTARPAPVFGGGVGLRHYARRRNGAVYADHVVAGGVPWSGRDEDARVLAWMLREVERTGRRRGRAPDRDQVSHPPAAESAR